MIKNNTLSNPRQVLYLDMTPHVREKLHVADKCMVSIMMLDTVIFAQVERLLFRAMDIVKEDGLYKREVKHGMNEIKRIIDRKRSSFHGNAVECFMDMLYRQLPECKMRHIKFGSKAEDYLLSAFIRKSGAMLYDTEKDFEVFVEKCGMDHPKLMATLSMLMGLCVKGLLIHEFQYKKLKEFLGTADVMLARKGELRKYVDSRIENSRINEPKIRKVIDLCKLVLKHLNIASQLEADVEDQMNIQQSIDKMCDELSAKELIEVTDSSLVSILMDYTEFYLACLRMDLMEDGKVDANYRKTLASVVDEDKVDELIAELLTVEPMREDEDLIDLAQRLPDSDNSQILKEFRSSIMRKNTA